LQVVFSVGYTPRLYSKDPRPAEEFIEGWQLNRALQGRMRRDGTIVELTVDKSSVMRYSPDCKNVSTAAGESSLSRSITGKRLVKAN
jgi:hypothetical protein